jgi:beta-phosphoglucomutase-like phosphatase (HAD superfamily)
MKHYISKGVRGLIFDLDGTLVDSMPYHYKAWKIASKKYGPKVNTQFLKDLTGDPSIEIAVQIIKQYKLDNIVSSYTLLSDKTKEFAKLQKLIKPINSVTELVKKYFGKLPMAIGTGGHRKAVQLTLEITDLNRYFEIVVTADDIINFKPHPETFLLCAELMRVNPEYVEVFEDTDQGLIAARRAGMIGTDVRLW